MSVDLDKVKKQLADVADLYEKEKSRTTILEQTLKDLRRREPIVQMLWQEVQLLRSILERHLRSGAVQMNLPNARIDTTQKQAISHPMTDKDKIAYLALRLIQSDQASNTFTTEELVSKFAPTVSDPDGSWLDPSLEKVALGGGNSRLSVARVDAADRLKSIRDYEASVDPLHGQGQHDISFEEAAGLSKSDDIPEKSPFAAAIAAAAGKKLNKASPQVSASDSKIPPADAATSGSSTMGSDGHEYDANGIPKAPADLFDGIPFGGSSTISKGAKAAGTAAAAPQKPTGPQPSKPLIKPQLKMKPLHWRQIIIGAKGRRTSTASNSIWNDIDSYADIVFSKAIKPSFFEAKFQSGNTKEGGNSSNSTADEEVVDNKPKRLLDAKRHDQLSFMLPKMPPFDAMKAAILTLDSKVITPEKLESLHKNLPTADEIALITSSGLPPSKLLLPEQWILQMSKIPQLSARIECWKFSQNFDEQFQELHRPLARIETACTAIRTSKALKQYMGIVLAVGNYMNGSTPRGQADGFTFDSLSKIARIKSADGDASLLDFTNDIALELYGEGYFEELASDLTIVSEVRSISLQQISNEGRKLSQKATLTSKMQSLVAAQSEPNDPFDKIMTEFHKSAQRRISSLEGLCKDLFAAFVRLMLYLEPNMDISKAETTNTEEFFSSVDDFVQGVIRSRRLAKHRREQAEARIKQAQQMQQLKKTLGTTSDAPKNKPRRTVFNSSGAPMVQLRSTKDAINQEKAAQKDETNQIMFPKLRSVKDQSNIQGENSSSAGQIQFPKLKPVNKENNTPVQDKQNSSQGIQFVKLNKVEKPVEKKPEASKPIEFVKLKPVDKTVPSSQKNAESASSNSSISPPTPIENDSNQDDEGDEEDDLPPPPPDVEDYEPSSDSDY